MEENTERLSRAMSRVADWMAVAWRLASWFLCWQAVTSLVKVKLMPVSRFASIIPWSAVVGIALLPFTIRSAGAEEGEVGTVPPEYLYVAPTLTPEMVKAHEAIKALGGDYQGGMSVTMAGPRFSDADLVHLQAFPMLEELNLRNSKVSDLPGVEKLTNLRTLYLDGSPVTDKGLEKVQNLVLLTNLRVDSGAVTNAGTKHLAGLVKLERLAFRCRKVSSIVGDLEKMDALELLDLSFSNVGDSDLRRIALSRGFGRLKQLVMSNTPITDGAAFMFGMRRPNVLTR